MAKKSKSLGTVVVAARDPWAPWVLEVIGTIRARQLTPKTIVNTVQSVRQAIEEHGSIGDPTRLVFHLREIDGGLARLLGEGGTAAGRFVLYSEPSYDLRLEAAYIVALVGALPHSTHCKGNQALEAELRRLTEGGGGAW